MRINIQILPLIKMLIRFICVNFTSYVAKLTINSSFFWF